VQIRYRRVLCTLGLILGICGLNRPVLASFPDRPVTLTVPVGPGGGTDLLARQLAKTLSQKWKQPVVVENRTGAAGIIGAEYVMKQAADGYNLLLSHDGVFTATPILYKRPDFKPLEHLAPISEVAIQPYVAVVNPSVPVKTMAGLIALIKRMNKEKKPFGFATSALGSADHMAGEKFQLACGVHMLIVPYKSTAPAITDVAGGHVPFGFFSPAAALPLIKSGTLRALAITTPHRSDLVPGLPTVAETLPGYHANAWFGVWAPAGTPAPILNQISKDIAMAVKTPEMAKLMKLNGLAPATSSPSEFAAFIKQDAAHTAELIRRAHIKVQ